MSMLETLVLFGLLVIGTMFVLMFVIGGIAAIFER